MLDYMEMSMFPNVYLKTLWQMSVKPQVFVAMSFADIYKRRFDEVIAPAIRAVSVNNQSLEPFRVDFSRTGDSILTDIMDGIAHCRMFLADISIIGHDSRSGQAYRNGNVMYEIGLALACRQPTEVLLIRDDRDRFLFDVSTIPHAHINFADSAEARLRLQEILIERLNQISYLEDARVTQAISSLSDDEVTLVKRFANEVPPRAWGFPEEGSVNFPKIGAIPRLLDKRLIRLVGTWQAGGGVYMWTELGLTVAQVVLNHVRTFNPENNADTPTPTDA